MSHKSRAKRGAALFDLGLRGPRALLVAVVAGMSLVSASAPAAERLVSLPAAVAFDAAAAAVRACEAGGYRVSATVVDADGEVRAFLKGDLATVHTRDSSFRKAYTVVTMAPVFGFDTLGAFVEKLRTNRDAAALASLPDILALPGAVAVRINGEVVAAIGVGGAPGGEKDEVCATAGLAAIRDRLGDR